MKESEERGSNLQLQCWFSHSPTISGIMGGSREQGLYTVFPTDAIVMCSTGSDVSIATEHLNRSERFIIIYHVLKYNKA